MSNDRDFEKDLKENYSDRLIRGILNDSYMLNNIPTAKVYRDNSKDSTKYLNYKEYSINWYDEPEALNKILTEEKDGQKKYKEGAAIISRNKVKEIQRIYNIFNELKYSRDPIKDQDKGDNKYHGNLLVRADFYSTYKETIAGLLAHFSVRVKTLEEGENCIFE